MLTQDISLPLDPEKVFKQVIKLVPTFRQINEKHSLALNNMKIRQGTNFPPLHKEVFDVDT